MSLFFSVGNLDADTPNRFGSWVDQLFPFVLYFLYKLKYAAPGPNVIHKCFLEQYRKALLSTQRWKVHHIDQSKQHIVLHLK